MPTETATTPVKLARHGLNRQQELFVAEYLVDYDAAAAYVRAGYEPGSDKAARNCASRLLAHDGVLEALDEAQRARISRLGLDADWTILGFKRVYLEAMRYRQYAVALKALENIGRCLGIYEKDNFQKRPVLQTIEQIKAELKDRGIDFDQVTARSKN